MNKYLLLALLMVPQVGLAMDGLSRAAKASEKTDSFDPESSSFSKMTTLRTWVAEKHQKDEKFMTELRRNVAMEVPENPFSFHLCLRPIANNPGDKRYFGKSFPAIKSIQLPFLQYVHDISTVTNPIVMELAASNGIVSWKIPLALHNTGEVYVNELSTLMLQEFQELTDERLKAKEDLKKTLHPIPGDCFDILKTHPHLKGKVHAIYVQNLLHFFNPVIYQNFLNLVDSLLAENGRAYLVAHSITSEEGVSGNPIFNLYKKQKQAGDMYPGFYQATGSCEMLSGSHAMVGDKRITQIVRPDDATPTGMRIKSKGEPKIIMTQWGPKEIVTTTQEVTTQFFTPTIYNETIKQHPSLEVIESFFIDKLGERHNKFSDSKAISHAAVILKKKPKATSGVNVSSSTLAVQLPSTLEGALIDLSLKESHPAPSAPQKAPQP